MSARCQSLAKVLGDAENERIAKARVLVVGAGGIGCELLKNLALVGFGHIEMIDLDTIDVTNLNRQFLFKKQHVGKSKSEIAKESIRAFNPELSLVSHHGSIMSPEFDLQYFESFDMVLNALDNLGARNHVNRMCLSANVPLVESGTKGYLGQVSVIRKGVTECYECQPIAPPKEYPVCTIRNTPSTLIHCIVWAKFLFSQLFGVADEENDVAPETADPEAAAGTSSQEGQPAEAGEAAAAPRKPTRVWAEEHEYRGDALFDKLFDDDVKTLLSMDKLWKNRKPPLPLDRQHLEEAPAAGSDEDKLPDQRTWSTQQCAQHFIDSVAELKTAKAEQGDLSWDKDDQAAMDFVTAAANLRATVFGIATKSRFDVKSMAGNIVPAIATTNAVIGGLIVMEALKILRQDFEACRAVFLSRAVMSRGKILNPIRLPPPNPKCRVCAPDPTITVTLDVDKATVGFLAKTILKGKLGMVSPFLNVSTPGPDGTISLTELITSDEDDVAIQEAKVFPCTLREKGIIDGTRCRAEDDLQVYSFTLLIRHSTSVDDEKGFVLGGDEVKPAEEQEEAEATGADAPTMAGVQSVAGDDDDDVLIVDDAPEPSEAHAGDKRRRESEASEERKRSRLG